MSTVWFGFPDEHFVYTYLFALYLNGIISGTWTDLTDHKVLQVQILLEVLNAPDRVRPRVRQQAVVGNVAKGHHVPC